MAYASTNVGVGGSIRHDYLMRKGFFSGRGDSKHVAPPHRLWAGRQTIRSSAQIVQDRQVRYNTHWWRVFGDPSCMTRHQ